jgi:MoaA/NifB/PqqE/SkfB family radical SAM enzyme
MAEQIDKGKIPLLVNDFVIREDICNSRCAYCLIGDSLLKEDRSVERTDGIVQFDLKKIKEPLVYQFGAPLKIRIDKVLNIMEEYIDASILKISGGEVFLIKNIIGLLEDRYTHYSNIQVLTNGTLLTQERIERLSNIPNINVQFTIDGHTLEMNSYRVKTQILQNKLMENLELLIKYEIPVEINCVLTDKNTENLDKFAEYLLRYEGKLILLPYPVRGTAKSRYFPLPMQLKGIERLIKNYTLYEGILPPLIYLLSLLEYLKTKRRTLKCSLPLCMFQLFDDGVITPCVNMWTVILGNILNEESKSLFDKIGKEKIYNLMLMDAPSTPFCKQCFTPWDIINLYLQNKISIEDLCRISLYARKEIKRKLEKLKQIVIERDGKK